LEFAAGVVSVRAQGDLWTFTAPAGGAPRTAAPALPAAEIASQLGLRADDLLDAPLWVDTGADQLLVPLKSVQAVQRAQPDSSQLHRSEEHTSELQSRENLVCRLLLEKK